MCCRTAQTASAYYWMECLCQCQATRNGRLCHIHQVLTPLFLIRYDYKYYNLYFLLFRNERNQLLLGIRHATRPQTIVPSSMLSSDSMHIGLLAAAAHAAATNSCFTVFYHPRLNNSFFLLSQFLTMPTLKNIVSLMLSSGLAHLSLCYHFLSTLKLFFTRVFRLACAFVCSLRQKSQAFEGNVTSKNAILNFLSLRKKLPFCHTNVNCFISMTWYFAGTWEL